MTRKRTISSVVIDTSKNVASTMPASVSESSGNGAIRVIGDGPIVLKHEDYQKLVAGNLEDLYKEDSLSPRANAEAQAGASGENESVVAEASPITEATAGNQTSLTLYSPPDAVAVQPEPEVIDEPLDTRESILLTKIDTKFGTIGIKMEVYNEDILGILRSIPSRQYVASTKLNVIKLKELSIFLHKMTRLDDTVRIDWDEKVKQEYDTWLSRPDYFVDVYGKSKLRFIRRDTDVHGLYLQGIQSFTVDWNTREYIINQLEAYKLPNALSKCYPPVSVGYSDEAKEIITKQLEKRQAILTLATAEDCPEIVDKLLLPLKPVQKVAVKYLSSLDYRGIISYDVGMGKTPIAIATVREIEQRIGRKAKVLIVVPAPLKTNWRREIMKFTGDDVHILSGVKPDEITVNILFKPSHSQWFIINYDIIGRAEKSRDDSGNDHELMFWPKVLNLSNFDVIIYDEAHKVRNMDSQRSRGTLALEAPFVIPLTGTAVVNRPTDLYPLLHIIDRETFNNYANFTSSFLANDGRSVKNDKELRDMLTTYMIRRKRPPFDVERISYTVELSPHAREVYNDILEGFYQSLLNPNFERDINSALAMLTRMKQCTSYDKIDDTVELALDFIDASEEGKDKVLIFSQFKDTCAAITSRLGMDALCITGDVPDKERYKIVDKFQSDPNAKALVVSTVASEGITLTAAHCVIFNDQLWTPAGHIQIEGRAFGRANDFHGGVLYNVLAENTVDQTIQEILNTKLATINKTVDGVESEAKLGESILKELITALRKGMK